MQSLDARPRLLILRVALVAGQLFAFDALAQTPDSPAHPLETALVVREIAPLERVFDGTVEAVNQATVSAQTAGRVAEIFYDVNDYVGAGAAIIRFTDVEQQAALRQADASLREAAARRREAEEEFRRTEQLYEAGSASKREYDQALAARDASIARVKSAESAVATAKQQVEYTLIRAPYAGIVTERHVEIGESVTVGKPLMSGLSLEQLRVVAHLPQNAALRVRKHGQANVITEEARVPATQVTIFPFADQATNTFRVRVELPSGQFGLYPGMFVKVAFVVGESERLLMPTDALLERSEITAVYVVEDGTTIRLRQIRTGEVFDGRIEVLAGLSEGEQIALDPIRAAILLKSAAANDREQ